MPVYIVYQKSTNFKTWLSCKPRTSHLSLTGDESDRHSHSIAGEAERRQVRQQRQPRQPRFGVYIGGISPPPPLRLLTHPQSPEHQQVSSVFPQLPDYVAEFKGLLGAEVRNPEYPVTNPVTDPFTHSFIHRPILRANARREYLILAL